jgi:Tol biopolymer transport system component
MSSIDYVPIKSIGLMKLKYLIPEKNLAIVQIIKSNEGDGASSYDHPRYWSISIPSGKYYKSPGRGYSLYYYPFVDAVSPDGNFVLFSSTRRFHELLELQFIEPRTCLFNTNTYSIQELQRNNKTIFIEGISPLAWSPDSRKLLYYGYSRQSSPMEKGFIGGIGLMNIYTGETKFLPVSNYPTYANWLPDSKSVNVFYSQSYRKEYKWHYDQLGLDGKIISSQENNNHLLSVSPDSKWLLYSDATAQRMMQNVYLINLLTSETTKIIRVWDIERVAWSPDHKWLVIPAITRDPAHYSHQQYLYSLQLINLQTKEKIELPPQEVVDHILKWSSDSKVIFYYIPGLQPSSVINKQINIYTREIRNRDDKLYDMQMLPDGRSVYSDKNKLYLVSADGKQTKQIFP